MLTNNTAVAAFSRVIAGSLLTAGVFVAGICAWWMVRSHDADNDDADNDDADNDDADNENAATPRPATIAGCLVALAATAGLFSSCDTQGKLMFVQQPMKVASAESLCNIETDPDFSILTVGTHNNCDSVTHVLQVPGVLPFLVEGRLSGVTLQRRRGP